MAENIIAERLRKVITRETAHCLGRDGGRLSNERENLKKRYLGYGYTADDERRERGLSTYVDRTLLETVEWAKPALMRVFCNDEIIRFDPRTPEQEQAAADATLYVNQVVFGRNMFTLVHDVLADGLYQRVGWCLAHCPKKTERRMMQYQGLTQEEAAALLADPSIGAAEGDALVERVSSPYGDLFNVTLHQPVEEREMRLDPIPSEQVLISSDARDVEHARFVACWTVKSASDLIKEGYSRDLIDDLPSLDDDDEMPETATARLVNDDDGETHGERRGSAREYRIYEAWLDFDLNGDGIAEKVKVTYCGEESCKILKWEEWPLYRPPLFSACSVPLPHQAVGLCVADLVSDLQDLRSELTRQYLDCLALSNQGEIVVNEGTPGVGAVEYDSLLARGVGSVHRLRGDASITPLNVTGSGMDALKGLDMSAEIIERRTGITSRTQSLAADTLQNTTTGASIMEESINQRLELVARVYAEMFFKPLGRYILHLLHRYQDKQVQLRLKGRFMQFDPRKWDPDMDISVAVGLGTGSRSKMLNAYQEILKLQQAFLTQLGPASPVRLTHIAYTCRKLAEAAGLEAPERFFGTDEDAQKAEAMMQQQAEQGGPSEDERKFMLEQQKAMAKMQLERQKAETEAQRKAYETQARTAMEKQKVEGQIALKQQEMAAETMLDRTRLMMGERGSGLVNVRGV